MNITILCDQKGCRFNGGSKVHHDHDTDACEHPFPQIKRYPSEYECYSFCKKDSITTHDLLEIDKAKDHLHDGSGLAQLREDAEKRRSTITKDFIKFKKRDRKKCIFHLDKFDIYGRCIKETRIKTLCSGVNCGDYTPKSNG